MNRFGRGKVKVTQGVGNTWQLKSDFKFPYYTTRLSDLQTIYIWCQLEKG
jgi:DNA polymerase V